MLKGGLYLVLGRLNPDFLGPVQRVRCNNGHYVRQAIEFDGFTDGHGYHMTLVNNGKVYDLNHYSDSGKYIGLDVKYLRLNLRGDARLSDRPFLTNIQKVYKLVPAAAMPEAPSPAPAPEQDKPIFQVIEDYGDLESNICDKYAAHVRQKGGQRAARPLNACLIEKLRGIAVIPFVSGGLQYYSAEDLHRKPHNHVTATQLQEIKARVENMKEIYWKEMKAIVPDDVTVTHEQWIPIKDLCKAEGTQEFRGNITMTYGFVGSGM